MSLPQFIAIFPQAAQSGDKVRIKGRLKDGAIRLIIDLANDTNPDPKDITYHFEWIVAEDVIVQAFKSGDDWMDYEEDEKSLNGPDFALEFAFLEDEIYVYLIHNDGHNLIAEFEPNFDISSIKSIQVLGDVEKISEISFAYN